MGEYKIRMDIVDKCFEYLKSVIGNTLNLPVDGRVEGTIATSVIGVMKGCSFVRVHDVKENVRAVRMAEAILHGGKL